MDRWPDDPVLVTLTASDCPTDWMRAQLPADAIPVTERLPEHRQKVLWGQQIDQPPVPAGDHFREEVGVMLGTTLEALFAESIAGFKAIGSETTIQLAINKTHHGSARVWFRTGPENCSVCTVAELQLMAKLALSMARWLRLLGLVGVESAQEPPAFLLNSQQVAALAEGVRRNTIAEVKALIHGIKSDSSSEMIELINDFLERKGPTNG
jgi:hypothetical protein